MGAGVTRAGVWGRSGRDQNKGDGRGGAGGKLTLGVVAGPRKMGVQGKLSHLSLSISTWHLGRASDQEAAYPCGPAGPVPAPAQPRRGRLAGPLCCQKPPRPPAAPTQPLGEAGAPCLEPQAALSAERERHAPCCFAEWASPVSPGCPRLDFGQGAGICRTVCSRRTRRIRSLASRRPFPPRFPRGC